jgi:putative addiction module killer protein
VAAVGEGVSEMRIDFGPGYRVYFKQRGKMVTILFGGDKDSQDADIKRAKEIADRLLPKQGVQDGTSATVRRG